MISIIVPVYNESKTILDVLNNLDNMDFGYVKEIILVDDGSKDNSNKLISNFIKDKKEFKLVNKLNGGKGSAIIEGIKHSSGKIIAIQDADLEYDLKDLKNLIDFLVKKNLKVVYGSRFVEGNNKKNLFYFGNRFLSLMTSIVYFNKITDMETCYKVFKKDVLQNIELKSKGFEIEPEITAKILKNKIKITEFPISYNPRGFDDGKKIKGYDGFIALWTLIKYRFVD